VVEPVPLSLGMVDPASSWLASVSVSDPELGSEVSVWGSSELVGEAPELSVEPPLGLVGSDPTPGFVLLLRCRPDFDRSCLTPLLGEVVSPLRTFFLVDELAGAPDRTFEGKWGLKSPSSLPGVLAHNLFAQVQPCLIWRQSET